MRHRSAAVASTGHRATSASARVLDGLLISRARWNAGGGEDQVDVVRVLHHQRRHASQHQRAAHLLAYGGEQFHLAAAMLMRLPVLHVDDSDHAVARDHGRREERLEGVFGKVAEALEPRIRVGLAGNGDQPPLPGHPAGEAFAHFQADPADFGRVRVIRSAQGELVVVEQVDQTRVAGRELHYQRHDALQYLLEAEFAHHEAADFLEKLELLLGPAEGGLEVSRLRHNLIIGRWWMVDGGWGKAVDGRWLMVDGERRKTGDGGWSMVMGEGGKRGEGGGGRTH